MALKTEFSLFAEIRKSFASVKATSDVQIVCGSGSYSAHQIVLASLSPFLTSMFRGVRDENVSLNLPDIYNDKITKFLKILYGIEVDTSFDQKLIELFNLVGINVDRFILPIQSTSANQAYELKPATYSGPLLSLDLDDDILRCEDPEVILPHTLDKSKDEEEEVVLSIHTIDDEEMLGELSQHQGRQCEVCRRSCDSDNVYNYHKLIHSTQYKLAQSQGVCIVCNNKFKKQYVQHHVREIHFLNLRGKYFCKQCGRNFTRKEKYEGHMSREHGAPMRYICNICGKLFSINSDLYKHRTLVHFSEPKLPCPSCGKLFKSQERLRRHQITHLDRKLKCDLCQKTFSRNDKLKFHMKTKHTVI